jgi:hypothetical protein
MVRLLRQGCAFRFIATLGDLCANDTVVSARIISIPAIVNLKDYLADVDAVCGI